MSVVDTSGLDELKEVIEVYNGLAERLTESQHALQREVLQLREELAEKNRQLARKNRLEVLGEMAAGVAHEIRNPLGGIELYAGLIGREAAGNERVEKWASSIHAATRDLSRIVGDILDFTRPVHPKLKEVFLSSVAEAAVELAAAALDANRITVYRESCGREAAVAADFHLLQRAFLNIVLNAADAMPDGGILTVTLAPRLFEGARAQTISFADTGPGIAPADLDRVFDPFFTSKEKGTGLGLAMVARIISAHNARITAGAGEARGAVFTITMPAAPAGRPRGGGSGSDSGR